MKYVVFGKDIVNKYSVSSGKTSIKENGKIRELFTNPPKLITTVKTVSNSEILRFEGELESNCVTRTIGWVTIPHINISEDEEVTIEKKVFRADLNECHIFTDKIMSEVDEDKEKSEAYFEKVSREFNKTMIESNEKMKQHCDIHHLSYANTNCVELFKYLFPDELYVIKDGKMVTRTWMDDDYTIGADWSLNSITANKYNMVLPD